MGKPVTGFSSETASGKKNGGRGRFEWQKPEVFEALRKAGLAECDDVEGIVWGDASFAVSDRLTGYCRPSTSRWIPE